MHHFLEELKTAYDQVLDNQIGRLTPGLSADEVVAEYRRATQTQGALRRTIDRLLEDCLFPMLDDVVRFTDEDETDLFEAAQSLSSFAQRNDPGLAFMIYKSLLDWARLKGSDDKIIKYLYWCGITLFYIYRNRDDSNVHYKAVLPFFEEAASYADRYDTFDDPETRQYIHRCMGNKSMLYYNIHGLEKAVEVEEENFAFWNTLLFRGKDADFPWLSYFTVCLGHRQNHIIQEVYNDLNTTSKTVLDKLLDLSITIVKLYNKNLSLYTAHGGMRYEYLLWVSQFFCGLISFDHLCENVEKCAAEFAEDDYSPDAIYMRIERNQYLMLFAANMTRLRDIKDKVIADYLDVTLKRLSSIPMSVSPSLISEQLQTFTRTLSSIVSPDEQLDITLKMTTYRHIQTYAHSTIVGSLSELLTQGLLEKSPECFIGCMGIENVRKAVSRTDDLCAFSRKAGLCHDIGILLYVTNPFMHARALTDEEKELVNMHPTDGVSLLSRKDRSTENMGFTDVILGHHRYFDNSGGYPESFDRNSSDFRIMIDIVSVADAIDLATDSIAKNPMDVSSTAAICEEIVSKAGSQFSPDVAKLLEDEVFLAKIDQILDEERKDAYYSAYLRAWET